MPRAGQIFFQESGGVAKGRARFPLGFFEESVEPRGIMNDAHAATTAAHRGFHNNGIADLPSNFLRLRRRLDRIIGPREHGDARRSSKPSSGGLVPKQL